MPQLLRLSVRSAHTVHHEVLGVAPGASKAEIKAAFLRKVKMLHPDLASRAGRSAAGVPGHDAFVSVVLAYQVLSDPQRSYAAGAARSVYTEHHSSEYAAARSAAGPSRSAENVEASSVEESVDEPDRIFGGYTGIARRARAHGGVWAALERAHSGPEYRGGLNDFPYAFEAEERNDALASRDLLHIVVGRQVLGRVLCTGTDMLPADADAVAQPLPFNSPVSPIPSPSARMPFTAPADDRPRLVLGSCDALEFHFHGKLVASAKLYGNGGGEQHLRDGDGAGDDEDDETRNYVTIYRHYEDGTQGPPLAHLLAAQGFGALHVRRVVVCDLVGAVPPNGARVQPEVDHALRHAEPVQQHRAVHDGVNADFGGGVWRRHGSSARAASARGSTRSASQKAVVQKTWNQSHEWIALGDEEVMPTFSTHHGTCAGARQPGSADAPQGHERDVHRHAWPFPRPASPASTAWPPFTCPHTGRALPHDPALVHPAAATHSLLHYRTLGIAHMRWLRHWDGAVEAAGTRSRLPPPNLWLWSPRAHTHTRGGWYVEAARRPMRTPAAHPAVYVLAAAVASLEAEHITAMREARGWRARVREAVDAVTGRA